MQKNLKYIFIVCTLTSLLYSCAPLEEVVSTPVNKTRTIDYYERDVTKSGIYQKPIVADLVVAVKKSTITRTYESISENEAKEYVSAEFSMGENCDVIVHPVYEVETSYSNGQTKITATVTGYAAHYKNLRNFELNDTNAYRIYSYINNVAEEKPKVATGAVNKVEEKKIVKPAEPIKTTFGIAAGITSAKQTYNFGSNDNTTDAKLGATLGMFLNIGLGNKSSFMPGLFFTQKGGREEFNDFGSSGSSKFTLNYLELPLNMLFYTKSGRRGLFFGGGPILAAGLSGNFETTFNGNTETGDINFGTSESSDTYKPFELGFNLMAGLRSKKGLSLAFNYCWGNNIALGTDEANNRYLGIRLGYEFGSK